MMKHFTITKRQEEHIAILEINGELKEDSSNNILNKKNINTLVYSTYGTVLSDKSKVFQDGQVKNYNLAFEINSFFH